METRHFSIYVLRTDSRGHQQGTLFETGITIERLPQMVFQALKQSNRVEVVEHA